MDKKPIMQMEEYTVKRIFARHIAKMMAQLNATNMSPHYLKAVKTEIWWLAEDLIQILEKEGIEFLNKSVPPNAQTSSPNKQMEGE